VAAETEGGATRAEYQVALEAARAALQAMEEKRDALPASSQMRALYQAEITRLETQILEMEQALADYHSPEKLDEREKARDQTWGDAMGIEFRAGNSAAATWLKTVRKHAGDRAWLFEDAELEADGYEQFTTPENKAAWRLKKTPDY